MAARTGRRRRERSTSADKDSEGEEDVDITWKSTLSSKLYATMLIVPGIILYVYILYIVLANLLYPCSLAPFLRLNEAPSANKTPPSDIDSSKEMCRLRNTILNNAALLLAFIAQHSLMACSRLKQFLNHFGLSAISRLIYVFVTCSTIQFINHFWEATPNHALWECPGSALSLFLKALHSLCWISIACSLFTIDYLELLGIKQLYYSYNGFGDPIEYKSAEQQYLLQHMRHPIFTAPFILLWAVPVMTYDRLLLAVMCPLYMACASTINSLDLSYVKGQFYNKWGQLLQSHK